MKFVIATNNKKKLGELSAILDKFGVQAISLSEAGIESDVEETGTTFEENSRLKAVSAIVGGGGGGRPDSATSGGKDLSKLDDAMKEANDILKNQLK